MVVFANYEDGIIVYGTMQDIHDYLTYSEKPPPIHAEANDIVEPVVIAALSTAGYLLLIIFLTAAAVSSAIDLIFRTRLRAVVDSFMATEKITS